MNLRSDSQAQQNNGIADLVQAEGKPCVVLVRHGQTAWNAEGRLQGQKDVDLNGCGLQQARSIAQVLQRIPIAQIYCSDLKRCVDTAREIATCNRRVATFFDNTSDTLDAEATHVFVADRNVNKMALKYLLGLSYEEGFRVEQENQRLYLFFPRSTRLWSCWVEEGNCNPQPGLAFSTEVYG